MSPSKGAAPIVLLATAAEISEPSGAYFKRMKREHLSGAAADGDAARRLWEISERLVGTATLTHDLPDGPVLVSPLEGGDPVDPNNAVVVWESVAPPNGSPIVAYQVLVVQLESPFPAVPKISLDVMMPATATSMVVPPGFLLPGTEYEWEVLAIESSGNQTLSSSFFSTTP